MPNAPQTVNALAQHLAHLTQRLHATITAILTSEGQQTTLHTHFVGFQQTLLPTLTPAEFADMYAQTLVYGLFAARVITPNTTTSSFTRYDVIPSLSHMPPFLQAVFSLLTDPHLDERIAWLVDDCAYLLERTDMAAVLHDFGKATKQEDPVVHFYETFLAAYDPKTREMRGVYYTPEPVVSYIVRSVDSLLRTQFGKSMGLADGETVILDPATGTATFLHAVVQHIHTTLTKMGKAAAWNQYVPEQLLPRLHGFELLMAPYTIAHLKLSLLLQQLGYQFGSDERLGIYLTNALADAPSRQQPLPFAQFIAEEGKAADAVKHTKPVMVVLGNPPYSGHSANKSQWIDDLLHGKLPNGESTENYYAVDGKPLGERNPKWLQDDYVKFLRFGQWRISQTGEGILAFISNNGYLDNPTFRGMRESLLNEFTTSYILNLHGNSRKKEQAPDGTPDENVFDIQQGVAISLFVKQATLSNKPARVSYADVWGKRNGKYDQLDASDVTTTDWQELAPSSPWYLFVPQDTAVREEYERGMKIPNILPINSVGIVTARDSLTIQWTRQAMLDVVQDFVSRSIEDARTHYQLGADARDWKVADAQENLRQQGITEDKVVPMLYRPFDQRYTYYTGKDRGFLCRPRSQVMQHMLHQKNLGLITVRQVAEGIFNHTLVTDCLVESRITLSNKGIAYLFPLYLYPNENNHTHPSLFDHDNGRRPNFSAAFIAEVEEQLGLAFIPDGNGDLAITVGPEDIFHYLYAVLHNPHYRSRYADFLKIDFPHIPITNDLPLFKKLAGYGATLVDLHLLRLPGSMGIGGAGGAAMLENPSDQGVTQHGVTTAPIERVHYDERTQQVTLGQGMYFAGIEPATWAMQVGGYQPLHKWLKDRKGRVLAFAEALHYMRMVVALRETRRVMGEIGEDKAT